jgi:hypothetical protein
MWASKESEANRTREREWQSRKQNEPIVTRVRGISRDEIEELENAEDSKSVTAQGELKVTVWIWQCAKQAFEKCSTEAGMVADVSFPK